jgi:hypothetical protein
MRWEKRCLVTLGLYAEPFLRFFPRGESNAVHGRQAGTCIEECFSSESWESTKQDERAAFAGRGLSQHGLGDAECDCMCGDTHSHGASLGDNPSDLEVIRGEDRLKCESAFMVVGTDDDAVMKGEQMDTEVRVIEGVPDVGSEGSGELRQGDLDGDAIQRATAVAEARHSS